MTSNKQLMVLGGVAVALVIATCASYAVRPSGSSNFEPGSLLIQGLDVAGVCEIAIRADGGEIHLRRSGDGFVVAERNNYPAATGKVNDLLVSLVDIRRAARISESAASHQALGVAMEAPSGGEVRLVGPGAKPLLTLLVGDDVPNTPGRYVRLARSDSVYASEKALSLAAAAEPVGYIDTTLLKLPKDAILSVSVKNADDSYTIARDADKKPVLQEIPKGAQAQDANVGAVLAAVSDLSFDDVLPAADADVEWETDVSCRLKHRTYHLRVGAKDDKWYLSASATGPSAKLVEQSRRISETDSAEQLAEKSAVLTAAEAADKFNNRHGNRTYEISERKAKGLSKPLAELIEDTAMNDEPTEVAASHILIAYKGAERSQASRSIEDARKLAEEVLAKAGAENADFAALAKEYSDCPSNSSGGDLGTFPKGAMDKDFEAAAWKLLPGQTSGIVETAFGFHLIKRTN